MIRRQHNPKYKVPAHYIENDKQTFFRCMIDRRRIISDPMGTSFQLDDGELLIETDADIDFKLNHKVKVNGDLLTVDNVVSRIPKNNDLNAYRGSAVNITRFIIK